ncbi:MAG: HAD family hydrolase [Pirellulaceae bacterium]
MTVVRGVIFDLDGTLVDSRLDFEAMRSEMELPAGTPILEALADLPSQDAARCREILHRHEQEGAARAAPLPGAASLIAELMERGLRLGIVTRNSRQIAAAMLAHFPPAFDPVISRDDGPAKPDPWSMLHTCRLWGLDPGETAIVGDYRYDIESGRRAGCRTVLVRAPEVPTPWLDAVRPDLHLPSLLDVEQLLAWCAAPPTTR